jgi:acyl-CoA hydrolase
MNEPLKRAQPAPLETACVRMIEQVFPNLCNHHGTLFGGEAMALMDKAAFLAASRHGRDSFVTASCDRIDFTAPIHEGELVEAEARLTQVGNRSVGVEVNLWGEAALTGERRLATTGQFTLVANKRDKATPLPPLSCTAPEPMELEALSDDHALISRLRFQDLVFPPQTNHYGTLFGGDALALMGRAAYVLATRRSKSRVLMAASPQSRFVEPVHEGEMVDIRADILKVGRSSVHVAVDLWAENLLTGDQRRAGSADYVMVAVDEAGRPRAV